MENQNLLYVKDFRFVIARLPTVVYNIVRTSIPSVSSTSAVYPTPFVNVPIPGDKLEFEPLTLEFMVDRDLVNYEELFNWMQSFGTPKEFGQYRPDPNRTVRQAVSDQVSEGTLFTSTNKDNPNVQLVFEGLHPINLGAVDLNLQSESVDNITCTASFAYTKFTIRR